jgi:nitroreductase
MTEGPLSRRTAEQVIAAAIAAPSMHNSQPWRFVARLADRVIEIYADPARILRQGDPRGRAVHLACGSALLNLRLAAAQAGYAPVTRLLPSARDPLLLASVRFGGPYRPRPAERSLYAAIGRRATGPSLRQLPPTGLLVALREAAVLEGASLRLLSHMDALRILPEPRTSSQLAVISTRDDDRAGWLRAGQATQRVLLLAAHRGLPVTPLSPALETPGAPPYGEPVLDGEYPAMILSLGDGWPGPPTARRPVAQVLRVIPPVAVTR